MSSATPKSTDLRSVRAGVGYRHAEGFVIDRPSGSGDILFLRFLTPVVVRTDSGDEKVRRGGCIVFAKGRAQWYCGDGGALANDWIHLAGSSVTRVLRQNGIPTGRVFYPSRSEYVPAMLADIETETVRRAPRWEEAVSLLIEQLFLHLGRNLQTEDERVRLTRNEGRQLEVFRDIRAAVHGELDSAWRVEDMAERAHLSPSRFAVLYKRFFGVSPIDDLVEARVSQARWLLTNTKLQVGEVAGQCGFENIYYFSRAFRRRVGCPPSAYYDTWIA